MNTPDVTAPQEAAVNTSTPSQTDTTIYSDTSDTSNQAPATSPIVNSPLANFADNTAASIPDDVQESISSAIITNPLSPSPNDPPYIVKYKCSVIAALANPMFTGDSKRVVNGL